MNEKDEARFVHSLLLPVARSVLANGTKYNRREAGRLLSHMAGYGNAAFHLVSTFSKFLKKVRKFGISVFGSLGCF
jgi:hypothetical protein